MRQYENCQVRVEQNILYGIYLFFLQSYPVRKLHNLRGFTGCLIRFDWRFRKLAHLHNLNRTVLIFCRKTTDYHLKR